MMVSFCAIFFPRRVLDEILNLIESVSEGFPSYFYIEYSAIFCSMSANSCWHYCAYSSRTVENEV